MKNLIIYFTVFAAVALFGPLTFIKQNSKATKQVIKSVATAEKTVNKRPLIKSFRVKISNNKVVTVNSDEYVIGCIAGEMPLNYNDEALKAQGVAAYTFALYKKQISTNDYDITADYTVDQTFLTDDELKKKWGSSYDINKKKLEKIVKSIQGQWVSYESKPALTVYHAVSSGVTYSAKDVWGKDVPYLKSVDSSFDKMSKDYSSISEFSRDEFYQKIGLKPKEKTPEIKTERNKNGQIQKLTVDGEEFDVSEFIKKLELKSQNFTIKISDKIAITNYGYGHGVGMSQYGANCLAEGGSTYKEILQHYYTGCSIEG